MAETWSGISGSATAGGFLAEWADGSWGGVSRAGTAEPRLESDLARHDASEIADPVEHNGLVRADRRPKPSLAAVRRMWGAKVRSSDPWVPLAGFSLLSFALFWPRRRLSPSALALALFCTLCWASLGPCNFAGASTVPDRASAARP